MKFSAHALVLALTTLALASLSSCGQRGPLYLPPPDVAPHSSAPAQPVQPAQQPSTPKQDDDKKNNQDSN
jgi:predicted small lipoprotein YifL